MPSNLKSKDLEKRQIPWLGIAKFLFIAILTLLFYLLAQSMVHHRFFRGGWMNNNGSVGR
jgi:hypothetical protein